MSIHRGIAASAALSLALTLSACTNDDPEPSPTRTPTASASPTPTATADPAGRPVPLDGDKDAPIAWTLGDGVDAKNPVVVVARRLLALRVLGRHSASWSDRAKIQSAAGALTDGKVVNGSLDDWTDSDKPPAKAPTRLLVQAPEVDGDTAVAWACIDPDAAMGLEDISGSALVQIKLAVVDGAWRATSYDGNPTGSSERVQACQDF